MDASTGAATTTRVMEMPSQEQIQQQHQSLKCPRCDSTNTKFCYYNNYSLSQPRHFCKACKRYWTRGGTLRHVPVGGGSRKNKRVRKPNSNSSAAATTITSSSNDNEPNTFSSQSLNHMLYGLPTNLVPLPSSCEVISNGLCFSGIDKHDEQHQLGGVGLGFSVAGILLDCGDHGVHRNGFSTPKQILQDLISNSNPSSLVSTFTESSNITPTTSSPTMSMSSLLASSLQQKQKLNFESLLPCELDPLIKGIGSHGNYEGLYMKDDHVKLENDDYHRGQYQIPSGYEIHDHHHQQSMGASDPSILWNNNISSNWLDPSYSSIGSSSISSLI